MSYSKVDRSHQPPAAVISEADPGAFDAARVVPKGAKIVRIGRAVAGYVATPARIKRRVGLLDLRMRELERLIVQRFGALRVDTDDAALIAEIAVGHMEPNRAVLWIATTCPGTDADAAIATAAGRRWTASRLGKALCLTLAERTALRIRTIRASDVTVREAGLIAAHRKREADRARAAEKRRAAGVPLRIKGDSAAAEAAAAGIDRRTIQRRKKRKAESACRSKIANINSHYSCDFGAAFRVPAWLMAAFDGPAISIDSPNLPPQARRIGALVAAAAAAQRAIHSARLH